MKILAFLIACFASIALAEDFKAIDGKEYKNVTVSRVEPDGIVVKMKSGISKLYFVELPKEVQQRFSYNPQTATAYSAQQAADYEVYQQQQEEVRHQQEEAYGQNIANFAKHQAVDPRAQEVQDKKDKKLVREQKKALQRANQHPPEHKQKY